ncbi:MAG TPA: zinc-binding alcohol dehydrogenase family protein [Mycobacteriales bacterium]|nr:zinc-binding alcohol dehydrogenase family protein [Mycobacteriales bacterium]
MKAAVYYETGAPDVFRYEDVPAPQPGPGEILLTVEAVSIEGGDTLNRLGGEMTGTPHIVGYQAAGTITALGEGADQFTVGDRVVTVGLNGSHAEQRVVPQGFAWPIPEGLDTVSAACIPVAYGTAHDCLFEFGRLQAGETVLVHAGAGGVGIAAIQMAKQAGARVLATASSSERLARLEPFGLDEGVDYTTHDFVAECHRITHGRGVDLIVESVGGSNLQRSLAALAYRGRCISLGDASRGAREDLDVSGLRPNNQLLSGYFLGGELFFGTRAYGMVSDQIAAVTSGALKVAVDRTFPLAAAADAHRYIESRQAFGRVVLIP